MKKENILTGRRGVGSTPVTDIHGVFMVSGSHGHTHALTQTHTLLYGALSKADTQTISCWMRNYI